MDLKCEYQTYAWGKKGKCSEVALLAHLNSGIEIDNQKCYAELWMGTHPNGPSKILSTDEPLLNWIEQRPAVLGNSLKKFGEDLPFLLKVLSVNKPLSIQAHPTKAHADELHRRDPVNYKDSNHKPEMAIALTPFEALLGFRPEEEIRETFITVPELTELVDQDKVNNLLKSNNFQQDLKSCFKSLMSADPKVIEAALSKLLRRLSSSDDNTRVAQQAALIERLYQEFPGDVGVFGPYFFNYLKLEPGEAIFLAANEPHAYISGDCVECMACSDNVVRAGLTPKFKDVETLCNMLTYNCAPPQINKFQPINEDEHTLLFSPQSIEDFAVARISVCAGTTYSLIPRSSASIFIIICGSAESPVLNVKRGSVAFLPSLETISFTAKQNLVIFQAFANIK